MNHYSPIRFYQDSDGDTVVETMVIIDKKKVWIDSFWLNLNKHTKIQEISHWTDDMKPIYRYFP